MPAAAARPRPLPARACSRREATASTDRPCRATDAPPRTWPARSRGDRDGARSHAAGGDDARGADAHLLARMQFVAAIELVQLAHFGNAQLVLPGDGVERVAFAHGIEDVVVRVGEQRRQLPGP